MAMIRRFHNETLLGELGKAVHVYINTSRARTEEETVHVVRRSAEKLSCNKRWVTKNSMTNSMLFGGA